MMNKKLLLVVAALHIGMMTHTMELDTKVKLPSACQLKKNFEQGGLGGFAYETGIHDYLDGKEMSLGLLSKVADTFRAQYLEKAYKRNPNLGMQPDDLLKKEKILQCILCRVTVVEKIDDSNMQHKDGLTTTMHTPIILPDQRELKESLGTVNHIFVGISKIHKQLGCFSQLSPIQIIEIVDICIKEYDCPPLDWIDKDVRQQILQCILRNSPEIYQKLCEYEAHPHYKKSHECLHDRLARAEKERKSKL